MAEAVKIISAEQKLINWVASCKYDPLRFVLGAFDWGKGKLKGQTGPDKWQKQQLKELGRQLKDREKNGGPVRFSTASGHGVGKSAEVAWVVLFYMATRPDCLGTVTANTERQLKNRTWRELAKWHKLSITSHWFKWERESFRAISSPETWFTAAIPWSETNSEAFAGQHEKYTFMLMDEASGIANIIFQVASGAMTTPGALWMLFGNPTRPSGYFYDTFNKQNHRWQTYNIDSRTAKMADSKYLQEIVDDYGLDSDYVRVRVLGQFPRQASAQLIPTNIVEEAQARKLELTDYDQYPLMMGADIARYGDDATCFVWRRGPKIIRHEFHKDRDLVSIAQIMAVHLEREPCQCFIDEIGVGAGVVDMLERFGHDVFGVSVSRKASNPRTYFNLRIELWDQMKKWLETADIPDEQRIKDQLIGPEYSFERKSSKMLLERKEDMKKRGLESPDWADALAMTFLVPGMSPTANMSEDDFFEQLRGSSSVNDNRDQDTGY